MPKELNSFGVFQFFAQLYFFEVFEMFEKMPKELINSEYEIHPLNF